MDENSNDSDSSFRFEVNQNSGSNNDRTNDEIEELAKSINGMQEEILDDKIQEHIYDKIREAMGTAILKDKPSRYKKYEGKIGMLVS